MGSKPITQRAGTKYGSAPVNNEVTVDAAGKEVARFPRMSPLKNSALVKGAGDVGYSKNQPIEFDTESLDMDEKDKGVTVSPAKQNRPAVVTTTEETEGEPTVKKGKEKTKIEIKPPVRTKEGDEAYAKLTPEQRKAQDDKYRSRKENQIEVGTGEFEPDEVVPGEKKTEVYQGNTYRKQTGVGRSSYGSRQDKRQTLSETRKEKRNTINELRARMKAGEITRDEFKDAKKKAKVDMYKQRSTEFATQKKNREYQQQQGQGKGGSVRLDDVVETYADYERPQQIEMGLNAQKAERVRNQAAAADAKSYFKAKAGLLTDDSFTIGSGLSDFKTNTPSLTKPKSLMYDLSSVGSNSPSSTQPFDGLSQEDQYTLARSGIQKRGYKMKGFGNKNK